MENKYNNLIFELIKQHPRYNGYESILQDIYEDVYEHSKVILTSVTNDDVIVSYLKKVINTSIITVPKKLNFNTRVRHRVITPVAQIVKQEIQESIGSTAANKVDDNVDNNVMIEEESFTEAPDALLSIDTPEIYESSTAVEEFVMEDSETQELELVDDKSSEDLHNDNVFLLEESVPVEDDIDDVDNEVQADEALEFENNEGSENDFLSDVDIVEPELEINESTVQVDVSLVDKMINGVNPIEESDEISGEDIDSEIDAFVDVENSDDSDLSIVENGILTDETENDSVEELDFGETDSSEMFETEKFSVEDDLIGNSDIEESDSVVIMENDEVVIDDTLSLFENLPEEVSLEVSEPLEPVDTNVISELVVEEDDDSELLLDSDNVLTENVNINSTEADFCLPSLECFDFEPEEILIDSAIINDELSKIDSKYPQKKILAICDLKYKQNKTVADISKELNLDVDFIVDVLKEIVDTVKD